MGFILFISIGLVISTLAVGILKIKKVIKGNLKTFSIANLASFFAIMIGAAVFFLGSGSVDVFAEGATGAIAASSDGLKYIAAALSTGLASIGAGIAVAISGSAAIGAISEKESLLGKTIIFVGLAEGIAIYGLIISIMILGA